MQHSNNYSYLLAENVDLEKIAGLLQYQERQITAVS